MDFNEIKIKKEPMPKNDLSITDFFKKKFSEMVPEEDCLIVPFEQRASAYYAAKTMTPQRRLVTAKSDDDKIKIWVVNDSFSESDGGME